MLSFLKVENFTVVQKAEMEFSPYLNVLTGETGAGKSILIGAVNLFLKKKIPGGALRPNGGKLVVEALFSGEEEELILRREADNNRSICYLNGRMVPFVQLKEEAEKYLNIYGQNDHTFLLNTANHRLFLDEFAQTSSLLEQLARSYKVLKVLISELEELKEKSKTAAERLDFINFQIAEIEGLRMERGEDEELEKQVKILSSAEEILSRSEQIIKELYQDDASVYNQIAENLNSLKFLVEIFADIQPLSDEIERLYNLLPELSSVLSSLTGNVEYDQKELEKLEKKLIKLNDLKKKYGMNLDQLLDKLEELRRESSLLANMSFSMSDKEKEIEKEFLNYGNLNRQIREKRKKTALSLEKVVEQELEKLEMKKARFLVKLEEIEPHIGNVGDKGTDRVEFYFSSNPGQEPGEIKNVASGGELSRLMLVLKSMIKDEEDVTHIFDEIDSGIGGKTAEFVGEKLKRIAATNQVICISHLPHIASFAHKHFLITKEFKQDATFSWVTPLEGTEKIKEIGRLMVGSHVTDDVMKAAEELLVKNSYRE